MSERSVLIVSASAGTGHLRAGEAILQGIRRFRPDWRAEHIDVLTRAPRWVKAAYAGGFELAATRAPRVWGGAYALSDGPDYDRARWAGLARRMLFRGFERLLASRRWDHVICTHFLPAQLAAGRIAAPPFTVVVTDFDLHRFWVQPRVGRYCVATEEVQRELGSRLVNVQISCTGIPIDPAFGALPAHGSARRQLELDADRPVVLVMGGGIGIGVTPLTRTLLHCAPAEAQIVVLCGKNEEAVRQLGDLKVAESRMRCFGYRTDMPMLYAAADVVVTKPGGLTTSEALATGRPLLLTRPVPGHEEANARVLTRAGAAWAAGTPQQIADALRILLADESASLAMRMAAARLARPHAARSVIEHVAATMTAQVAA